MAGYFTNNAMNYHREYGLLLLSTVITQMPLQPPLTPSLVT